MKRWLITAAALFTMAACARAQTRTSVLDVTADFARLKAAPRNAAGDGKTNDSAVIQSAMDYLSKHGGGTLVFPVGVYRVSGLVVPSGVTLAGTDRKRTIFRAWDSSIMFDMRGGTLSHFTAYGTPTVEVSGANWKVGTKGVGKSGTARALMIIRVGNTPKVVAKDVRISNVTALESRYDCLYTRGSQGLRVINCDFDRAGRNVVSMVGNDEDFLFEGCRIGSLWGLYHFDIEPNKGHYVRNGIFLNCVFDGSHAGEMNTDSWGKMFMFSGDTNLDNRNIAMIGCRFEQIAIRVRGVFPNVQFLYNGPFTGLSRIFVKVRTNKVGEFRDAVVRGNHFADANGRPLNKIIAGATFTGRTVFTDNIPVKVNEIKPTPIGHDTEWKEDHPVAQPQNQPKKAGEKVGASSIQADDPNAKVVTVPLMGHRLRFKDGVILKNREAGRADVIFHIDPVMAEEGAGIELLGTGTLKDYENGSLPDDYSSALWEVRKGQVIAVRTQDRETAIFKVLSVEPKSMTIEYLLLGAKMADGGK